MSDFKWWLDAARTTEFVGTLDIESWADGTTPDQDFVLYLGSNEAGTDLVTITNPAVDQINFSIADNTPAAGPEVADIKLALSNAGLDAAVAGAALDVGLSLAVNVSLAVHIRVSSPALAKAEYLHLSITDNGLKQT